MGLFWLFSKAVGVFLDLFKRVLGSEAENALAFLVVLLQTESNIFLSISHLVALLECAISTNYGFL